jgi:hypothetical protein
MKVDRRRQMEEIRVKIQKMQRLYIIRKSIKIGIMEGYKC